MTKKGTRKPTAEQLRFRAEMMNQPVLSDEDHRIEQARLASLPDELVPDREPFWPHKRAVTTEKSQQQLECSRCGSKQLAANAKGYGAIKGFAGLIAAGPLGLFAGFAGTDKVKVTCLACGHSWNAGSRHK